MADIEDEKKSEDIENAKKDSSVENVENEGQAETEKKEKDNRSFGEKVEDTMDDVVYGVQNFLYGERKGLKEDIPATMPDPDNEIRHVNKQQTRANFSRKYGFKILKWMFLSIPIIIGIVIVAVIFKAIIG